LVYIFFEGFSHDCENLLKEYGFSCTFVSRNLKIPGHSSQPLFQSVDLIIFPSGGLFGIYSLDFKRALEKFVHDGGTIIVLSQGKGFVYDVLPGEFGGYGWNEDDARDTRWAYIEFPHPIFLRQEDDSLVCKYDGYLTTYPPTSKILLRNPKTHMPILIAWRYGRGKVIVTSLYPDYAYGIKSLPEDEKKLFNDMIIWGLNNSPVKYISPCTDSITLLIPVENLATINIPEPLLRFRVYTPEHNKFRTEWLRVNDPIFTGINVSHLNLDALPYKKGIWSVGYTIYMDNLNERIIQGEKIGLLFSQDKFERTEESKDFYMYLYIPDYASLLQGTVDSFLIIVKNNTQKDFSGKIIIVDKGLHTVLDSIGPFTIRPSFVVMETYRIPRSIRRREGIFLLLFDSDDFEYNIERAKTYKWLGLNHPPIYEKTEYVKLTHSFEMFKEILYRIFHKLHWKGNFTKNMYAKGIKGEKLAFEYGDSIRIFLQVQSGVKSWIKLALTSASTDTETYYATVKKGADNHFLLEYPSTNLKNGINELTISLIAGYGSKPKEYEFITSVYSPDSMHP